MPRRSGGGGFRSQLRGRQPGQYRRGGQKGGRRKGPRQPQGPSHKQLIKAIRRACTEGDGASAVAALRRAVEQRVLLDAKTLQQVVEGFVKVGLFAEARSVLLLVRPGTSLSPLGLKAILSSLPQIHAIDDAMATGLVDDLCAMAHFNAGPSFREFFRTRARWAVLEFVSEARSALESIERQSPSTLERRGKVKLRCTFEKGMKGGEIVVRSSSRKPEFGRGFCSGDAVRIAEMGSTAAYEGVVVREMPLILKLADKRGNAALLRGGGGGGGGGMGGGYGAPPAGWRVDKMANAISYTRSIAALTYLTSRPDDAVAGGKGNKKSGEQQLAKNNPRPAEEITRALCESLSTQQVPSPLHPGQLAAYCASPCVDHIGRPVQGTGSAESFNGPTAGLNASQRIALGAATSRRLSLVQGPPGTGKTAVAVRILTYWARSGVHGRGAVLCCSDSNIAGECMVVCTVTYHFFSFLSCESPHNYII